MTTVEPIEGLSYYMDDKLREQLDKVIKTSLEKRDEDYVAIVDGAERAGKSTFAMQIGKYIDPSLDLDRVCFSPDEFRNAIIKAGPKQCVIFDEAFRGLSSRTVLSEVNRVLISLFMEIGQKNLFIIVVLPTFYLLDRYLALFRSRVLFHVYRRKGNRSYWRAYNEKKKILLYSNPKNKTFFRYSIKTKFRGRFHGKCALDETEYRKKKAKALKEGFKQVKISRYLDQRNKLIYLINQEMQLSIRSLQQLFNKYNIGLKRSNIGTILKNIKNMNNK